MIDTFAIYEKLKEKMDPSAAEGLAEVLGSVFLQLQESLTEKWFQKLDSEIAALRRDTEAHFARIEETLAELIEVQRQHSAEIAELRETVRELVEVQRQHSEQIAELRQVLQQHSAEIAELRETVRELVEVQRQHSAEIAELRQVVQQHSAEIAELRQVLQQHSAEIAELRQTVRELVEVQRQHSEQIAELRQVLQQHSAEIAELREAQKRTEKTLADLIQVVRETQEELRRLAIGLDDLRKQVGGLAMTVGYSLEDEAYKALPALLAQQFGLQVEGRLKRQYVEDREGNYIEVNIFGQARRDGETVTIVGEGKVQLSKNDVDSFIRRKLERLQGVYPSVFPLLVTRMTSEWDVEEYARRLGIAVYYSYEF